jgi:hypothetical protein
MNLVLHGLSLVVVATLESLSQVDHAGHGVWFEQILVVEVVE